MEIILLIGVIGGAWLWFDSITARETAIEKGSDLAARCNLQLLDETVACSRLRLGRNNRGHVRLLRTYDFEVSATGSERLTCQLVLLGKQLQSWHIPPYLQAVH
ncbi:hypothetical protein A7981_04625 [Methylovorus sp. MM2]|uniref:DUF3301 domain-containing protein n=1 Tax=Methylovorus sp. MM2 TaxID=1848038 RepID=UPI0007DFEF64|nr:DUF3301 domain-containing protein [Methylovorus sp. MM2]OAM52739.1 hypothetical protein A7981_04625 [Methylovorus sp. MM2]